jgi:AraC-like DNA-binding protein
MLTLDKVQAIQQGVVIMRNKIWYDRLEIDEQMRRNNTTCVTDFGYFQRLSVQYMRMKGERDDCQLIITVSGDARIQHGGKSFHATPGSISLYLQNEAQYYTGTNWVFYWFHFYPSENLLKNLRHHSIDSGRSWNNILQANDLNMLYEIFTYQSLPNNIAAYRAGILIEWLLMLCTNARSPVTSSPGPTQLYNVRNLIELSPSLNLTVAEMADMVSLTPSRFAHKFTKEFEISPHAFLIKSRIEKAKQLLLNKDLSAAETGRRVGYENPYHFYKAFKKHEGLTPVQFRKKAKCQPKKSSG